jgi:hypothetical protein
MENRASLKARENANIRAAFGVIRGIPARTVWECRGSHPPIAYRSFDNEFGAIFPEAFARRYAIFFPTITTIVVDD